MVDSKEYLGRCQFSLFFLGRTFAKGFGYVFDWGQKLG